MSSFFNYPNLISIKLNGSANFVADGGVLFNKDKTRLIYYLGSHARSYSKPYNMTVIDNYAFCICEELVSIIIPEGVSIIGRYTFQFCDGLFRVNLPKSVTVIKDGIFSERKQLSSINIPDSISSIVEEAFRGCAQLASINIPHSVTSIGSYAFSECDNLESIYIPSSVEVMGDNPFACSPKLKIDVHDNPKFIFVDDVLHDKDRKRIILCSTG